MGTGLLTVVDHKQNMISVVRNLEEFFSRESCGWCTPCRDGLPWSVKMLMALEQGRGHASDLVQLEHLTKLLGPGRTFCAHAPGAMEPLQSALKFFRAEFEAGVSPVAAKADRSEEHTSELQSLMRISYAVFCLTKTKKNTITYSEI